MWDSVKLQVLKSVFVGLVILTGFSARGQIIQQCVDSNRIDPYYQCNDPRFDPVCGCNRKTYRNDCVSFRVHGVNNIFSDGVCQEDLFFWSIYPNAVQFTFNFYLQFYNTGSVTIEIRDQFGKLMFQQNDGPLNYIERTIDVSSFRPGVYFIMVYSVSLAKYEYKRFVKY